MRSHLQKTALLLASSCALLTACSKDPQLIVVLHSDYMVPSELSSIEVSVSSGSDAPVAHRFDLSAGSLPLSFGVLAPGGDRTRPLLIEVRPVGSAASSAPLIRRRLVRFPDVTSRLGIFIAKSCEQTTCPLEQSCSERGCEVALVPAAELDPVVEGEELNGLCVPGTPRCADTGNAIVRCPRFGGAQETVACPGTQTCLPNPARCSGGPGEDVRLTVTLDGDAEGRVISEPAGINCSSGRENCEAVFPRGTNVALSVAETNGTFGGWGGACSGGGDCTVEMDGDRQVSASFVLEAAFTLSVVTSGSGSGVVASDPSGIDCGAQCTADFPAATLVTLQAEPDATSTFVGWSGACSGTGECRVTMSSALLVGAEFAPQSGPQLVSVVLTGDGGGSVVSAPSGIDCGTECSASFPFDSALVLEATPESGSVFSGWQGASCSGTADCNLTVNQPHTVVAEFVLDTGIMHRVALTKQGTGDGSVSSDDGSLACGIGCSNAQTNVLQGTTMQLRATVGPGATFDGWAGDCASAGTNLVCSLRVDAPKSVVANFSAVPVYPVQVTVNGGGRVIGPGIDCPGDCTESFTSGTVINLGVMASSGQRFVSFQGGGCAQYSPCTTAVNAPGLDITAAFQAITPSRYDFNNDGLVDLLFAAPDMDVAQESSVFNDAGRVYVRFGGLAGPSLPPEVAASANRIYSGAMPGTKFGASLAAVGDITGDGFSDFAVGAPGENGNAGVVRIIPGGPNMPASGPTTSLLAPPGVLLVGLNTMRLGASLASVPDQDQDGRAELLVGAPGGGPSSIGEAYLFHSSVLAQGGGGVGVARTKFTGAGGGFGAQVASIGDFSGDGQVDIAISAPMSGLQTEGSVTIYFGPFPATSSTIDRPPDLVITGSSPTQNFGDRIIGIGDFNQNGFGDLAVGARNSNSVYIFYGGPSPRPLPFTAASANLALAGGGFFGASLGAGDVNGDNVSDLLVGAPSAMGPGRGTVTVFSGGTSPNPNGFTTLAGICAVQGACASEGFGHSVSVWGDINRDGILDVVVGSNYGGGNAGANERGRITAFYGGNSLVNAVSQNAPVQIVGEDQANGHCSALPSGRAQ